MGSYLLLLLGTNIFTYKVATEKTNFEMFLYEVGYDFALLKGVDEINTDALKSILVGSIGRVFYEAGKADDLNAFMLVCKYFTHVVCNHYFSRILQDVCQYCTEHEYGYLRIKLCTCHRTQTVV